MTRLPAAAYSFMLPVVIVTLPSLPAYEWHLTQLDPT